MQRMRIASAMNLLIWCILFASLPTTLFSLKIYIHDLPRWKNASLHGDVRSSDYGLDQVFPEALKNSRFVTTDPEEADFFFADAWIFWPHALNPLSEIVAAIRKQGPWFDRNGGADYIFVITADQGRCQYDYEDTRKSIFLQHYGGNLHHGDYFTHEKSLLEKWGGTLDREMILSEAIRAEDHCRNVKCTLDAKGQRTPFFCHITNQDIVVPPVVFEQRATMEVHHGYHGITDDLAFATPWTDEAAARLSENRTITLLHAGSTHFHKAEFYSLGARQTMIQMFGHGRQPGFILSSGEMSNRYWHSLLSSVFCLATTGTGWGSRFKVAVNKGCIPLIVMDGVKNEFEEQLPLHEYAIRLPLFMAYRTPEILRSFVESGRVKRMQDNLKCAWRFHHWKQPHGLALEVVMCELKRRKLGLTGLIPVDFNTCSITCGDEVLNFPVAS